MILYISFEECKKRTYCLFAASQVLDWFQELKRFNSREELLIWLDLNVPDVSSMPMKNVKLGWICKVYESIEICMNDVQAERLYDLCLGDNAVQEYAWLDS